MEQQEQSNSPALEKTERHHHHHHHHHSGQLRLGDMTDRRQLYRRAAAIMPGIILVIGFCIWSYGVQNDSKNDLNTYEKLRECGIWMMAIGGGILFCGLVMEWYHKAKEALHDHKLRREEEESHRRHHHHHAILFSIKTSPPTFLSKSIPAQ